MIPTPMASTASAVATITTTGRRYQASATGRVATGCESRSKLACGRGAASPAVLLCSGYSPGRIGTMPESSSASSDQASAGAGRGSTGISDLVVASATVPAAVGANAVSLSAGPRAARKAAPVAAVSCGRGAVMIGAPSCTDRVVVGVGVLG